MKQCGTCKQWKDESEFHKNWHAKGGLCSKCKDCKSEYDRWNSDNRDKVKHYVKGGNGKRYRYILGHVYRYGLKKADYKSILELQGGVCAICGQPNKSGRRLCIDHDHKTGKVRGLLCNSCNVTLGAAKDDKNVLLKMVAYLERNG